MVAVTVYVEGSGPGDKARATCRQAFQSFFANAGLQGRMPRVIACGSRERTFDYFRTAMRSRKAHELPILLVDSEGPVERKDGVWTYLQQQDGWSPPEDATDDQAYLMAQVMETWFIADRAGLARFFGQSFRESALPARKDIERVPKADILDRLRQATQNCTRPYAKGDVSFKVLGQVDPAAVEAARPHAKRLLDRLRSA